MNYREHWQEQVKKDIDGLSPADLLDYITGRAKESATTLPYPDYTGAAQEYADFCEFAVDFSSRRLKNLIAGLEETIDEIENNETSEGLAQWRCGC